MSETTPTRPPPPPSYTHDDLRAIVTPSLLTAVHDTLVPFPKQSPLSGSGVGAYFFGGAKPPNTASVIYNLCFEQALLPLARFNLPALPTLPADLIAAVLPPASAPTFPEQALGLVLLLDQTPRYSLDDPDSHWCYSFFGSLGLHVARALLNLPWALRPDNPARWEALGYDAQHADLRRMWFYVAIVHSEEYSDHLLQGGLFEEMRRGAEERLGEVDERRGTERKDAEDVTAFSKTVLNGPPKKSKSYQGENDADVPFEVFLFWMCWLMRVHEPIIRRYGKYPYRNGSVGRDDTDDDREFMRLTNGFGGVDDETRSSIREAVKKRVWDLPKAVPP